MAKQSQIAKIHIAKQQLKIPEGAYRLMLKRFGVTSSKDLTNVQAERVIDEFIAKGWKPKKTNKTKGKPHNFNNQPAIMQKIEALLADMGLRWNYADSMAKRMFKIDKVVWIKKEQQLHDIVAALYYKQQKDYYHNIINDLCKKHNISNEEKARYLSYTKGGEWVERKHKFEVVIKTLSNLKVLW